MFKKFLLVGLLFFSVSEVTYGEIILSYNLTGSTGNQVSNAAALVNSNGTASSLGRGSGVNASAAGDSISSDNWTTSNTPNENDYYSFTFGAKSGFVASINNLSFSERRSGTGIRAFELRTSTDGFLTFASQNITSVPDNTSTRQQSILLTGLSNIAGSVEFRLYGYLSEAATGTWRLANNTTTGGVTLDGTITAVPEPTSMILLGLASVAGVAVRARRRLAKKA